jgi:NDP-sugar pyrophosphorylase family protein
MQALILAGGKGSRLLPYTKIIPKPLMPIGEMPILEIILRQLKNSGFDNVILAVNYLSQMFELFFQNGEKIGMTIDYSYESKPLGTAGPIANAFNLLEDDFLVMNGDILTSLDFKFFFEEHLQSKATASIATSKRNVEIDFGVIHSNDDNSLIKYEEKPNLEYMVSMGINVLKKDKISKYLNKDVYLDIPDLMKMILQDEPSSIKCLPQDCEWLDMGRIDDYSSAIEKFEENKSIYLKD